MISNSSDISIVELMDKKAATRITTEAVPNKHEKRVGTKEGAQI